MPLFAVPPPCRCFWLRSALVCGLAWIAGGALAGPVASVTPPAATLPVLPAGPSWSDRVENAGRLHHEPGHPWVQELWFLGRYHVQQFWTDGPGDRTEGVEHRRARIGAQGRFFQRLTQHAQMLSGTDFEPDYNGFTELWAQWSFDEALALTVGQQKHRFTHERNVSSRYLNTLERGLLINMMGLDYTPAVTLSGKRGSWAYYTGWFSNLTQTDMGRAFTEFNAGSSYLASVTYDLKQRLGTDTAHWNVGYLHSQMDADATHLNRYTDAVSSALILTDGPCSLILEGLAAVESAQGDAFGFTLHPGYFLTDKLQVVGRYQIATASDPAGLQAQRRYERLAGGTTGDFYQAVYAGLNYHLLGHRLKLMGGVEYAQLGDEEMWTASVALRLFWGPHSSGPFPMVKLLKPRR